MRQCRRAACPSLSRLGVTILCLQASAAVLGAGAPLALPRQGDGTLLFPAGSGGRPRPVHRGLLLLAAPPPAALGQPSRGVLAASRTQTVCAPGGGSGGSRSFWSSIRKKWTSLMGSVGESRGGMADGGGAMRPRVIVISGPTAVGKSAAAERIALKAPFGAELISADSVQVALPLYCVVVPFSPGRCL